jgi:hypothetical protein
MADDARISTALPRHPKTVKLLRRLQERGGWALLCLFLWVAENRSDGNLEGLTGEDIEIAANWAGEPGAFISGLATVGFLDGEDGAFTVHDWAEHNPWAANRGRRIEAARAAASIRWERAAQPTSHRIAEKGDATRMPVAYEPHANSNADSMPTTQPDPTQPNLTPKPSAAAAASVADDCESVDPRHRPVREFIQEMQLKNFRVKCQWDGSEGKALDRLLSANPSWTEGQILEMVRNRFESEGIASDRPRKWLPNIGSYAAGPQDRYNKLKGADHNGNGTRNRAGQRQAINLAAAAAAKRDLGLVG